MWYKVSNGSDVRPTDVDLTSSKEYFYVRRNIVRVEASGEGEEHTGTHYEWEECRIPKDAWPIMEKAMGHDTALDDVYGALTELAEIIVGG